MTGINTMFPITGKPRVDIDFTVKYITTAKKLHEVINTKYISESLLILSTIVDAFASRYLDLMDWACTKTSKKAVISKVRGRTI